MSNRNDLSPGDLAIIVKSLDGLNTGKIVECVQIDFVNHPEYGTIWLVQSSNPNLISEYGGISGTVHVPQSWLRKIPNDPLPDEETNLKIEETEELSV